MALDTFLLYLATWTLVALSPGPAVLFSMSQAARHGMRGAIAGTASSFLGFYTTILGAFCGFVIGQAFDGTVLPVGIGYAALGGLALIVVAWTERGRLFRGGVAG